MNVWITLIIVGLITYGIRLSMIALIGNRELPVQFQRFLRLVPTAVLSALVFPEVMLKDNSFFLSPMNFKLIAAAVAVLVAWRSRNTLLTIVAGMATLLILQAVFP
jgi:branched-subunit amino acid transport protein